MCLYLVTSWASEPQNSHTFPVWWLYWTFKMRLSFTWIQNFLLILKYPTAGRRLPVSWVVYQTVYWEGIWSPCKFLWTAKLWSWFASPWGPASSWEVLVSWLGLAPWVNNKKKRRWNTNKGNIYENKKAYMGIKWREGKVKEEYDLKMEKVWRGSSSWKVRIVKEASL